MPEEIDGPDNEHGVGSCGRSHAALADHLRALGPVDPAAPSLLPEWTVGHVLTHIARNGDSILAMLHGRPQYPSIASRNADIESGARRAWVELIDDVIAACTAVDGAFDAVDDWSATALTVGGERPRAVLPLLRQREVEVHRSDLGLGYGFAGMPDDYVRRDLGVMEMLWQARQPPEIANLPDAATTVVPSTRLAWLMGRADIDGLEPAGVF